MEDVAGSIPRKKSAQNGGRAASSSCSFFLFSDHAVHGIVILPYPITPCLFLFHFLF
ncbi:MAG: hypothetical protein ACLUB3_05885 [Clostridium sp.]